MKKYSTHSILNRHTNKTINYKNKHNLLIYTKISKCSIIKCEQEENIVTSDFKFSRKI